MTIYSHPLGPELVIDVVGEEVPLAADVDATIEEIWRHELTKRPTLFNGQLFTVDALTRARLSGHFTEYRRFVAQQREPRLFNELQVRPLGVSGLLRCRDGIVFGLRGRDTTLDSGSWELVPSGGIDESCRAGSRVNARQQILTELAQEVGITAEEILECRPFVLVEDQRTHVLDVGFEILSPMGGSELEMRSCRRDGEYTVIRVVALDDIDRFTQLHANEIVPVSLSLLRAGLYLRT